MSFLVRETDAQNWGFVFGEFFGVFFNCSAAETETALAYVVS